MTNETSSMKMPDGLTVVVNRRIKPGREAEFEQAMRSFVQFALSSRCFYGCHVAEPEPRASDSVLALRSQQRCFQCLCRDAFDLGGDAPSVDLQIREELKLTFDSVFFWRESLNDGIYGPAINLLRSGRASRARFIGSQPSVQIEWEISRHFTWGGVLTRFFTGPFLKETGPGRDVNYVTTWLTYKF